VTVTRLGPLPARDDAKGVEEAVDRLCSVRDLRA
jgi:hypothetical protein